MKLMIQYRLKLMLKLSTYVQTCEKINTKIR